MPDDEEVLERIGKRVALVILGCAFLMISWMLFKIFTTATDDRPPRILPKNEKVRVERLLKKHGLLDGATIIEVADDGSYWFERGGRRCQLK